MVNRFLIAFLCLFITGINAQKGTVSPYSFFGIGDFRSNATVENQMMGGLQMFADSIHINLQNPAAYSSLRLTTYTAGIGHTEFRLEDANEEQRISNTNLDYLAIGLPIAKNAGIGFGLIPFSSVGYRLVSETDNGQGETILNNFDGEGGLNRAFISVGYAPFKNLSLGVTANFNFGTLTYDRVQSVEGVLFGTRDLRESRINGFDFNYALNYTPTIGDKYTLYTHIGIDTQVNLVSENSERISSFSLTTGAEVEAVDVNLAAQNLANTELKIPTTATFGLGFGKSKKWFVGGEYSLQALGEFSNDFITQSNVSYGDASSFAFGTYFIPDYRSIGGYLKRVTYRAGLRYDQTGLVVSGKEINNFGITFGFGLPLSRNNTFSNINLGFELGRRGTTDQGLIREDYLGINIGLSLNAQWFIKRKIN